MVFVLLFLLPGSSCRAVGLPPNKQQMLMVRAATPRYPMLGAEQLMRARCSPFAFNRPRLSCCD